MTQLVHSFERSLTCRVNAQPTTSGWTTTAGSRRRTVTIYTITPKRIVHSTFLRRSTLSLHIYVYIYPAVKQRESRDTSHVVVAVVLALQVLSLLFPEGRKTTKRKEADAYELPERNRVPLHRGYGRRWHTD